MKNKLNLKISLSAVLCIILALLSAGCGEAINTETSAFDISDVPEFSVVPYVEINGNSPYFTEDEYTTDSFEHYGELDALGRCTEAFACVGRDLMPTEKRESISSVLPSGWNSIQYDCVDGKNLYNRCHLIAFQLTGENANKENLITGTRFMNTEGMLPFENMTADYIKETGNHVMYRVTPIFEDSNLVASGVLMEGYSVEDRGEGICFNVYCYNNQPEITINYATGESSYSGMADTSDTENNTEQTEYVLNTNTKKFHLPYCDNVTEMNDKNREYYYGSRNELISQGYTPCKNCNP